MARRSKTGGAWDIVEIVALLPWWAGVLLALVSYIAIQHYAGQPLPDRIPSGEMAAIGLTRALASVGQYLLPLLFLAGAGVSAAMRNKRRRLLAAGTGSRAQQAIAAMDWREFEMLLAAGFRQRGFQVRERGGAGADGGVDLVLVRGGERFLVQCKHWRANAVGVEVVRELYGVMVAAGAAGGYVVTSGTFTRPARDFASGRNIELVDGSDLLPLLRTASVRAVNHAEPISKAPELADAPLPTAAPECPECGAAMVLRTAKRGKSARSRFWGCSRYPRCRGTRAMS